MFRSTFSYLFVAIAALVMVASSANARPHDAGANNVVSTTLEIITLVQLGGTSVKPGTYTVKADDSKVTLLMNGKQVAQAAVQWKDTQQKSKSTSLLAESGSIKEIHFSGKTRYVKIAQ
jgi:hypothetical protein